MASRKRKSTSPTAAAVETYWPWIPQLWTTILGFLSPADAVVVAATDRSAHRDITESGRLSRHVMRVLRAAFLRDSGITLDGMRPAIPDRWGLTGPWLHAVLMGRDLGGPDPPSRLRPVLHPSECLDAPGRRTRALLAVARCAFNAGRQMSPFVNIPGDAYNNNEVAVAFGPRDTYTSTDTTVSTGWPVHDTAFRALDGFAYDTAQWGWGYRVNERYANPSIYAYAAGKETNLFLMPSLWDGRCVFVDERPPQFLITTTIGARVRERRQRG